LEAATQPLAHDLLTVLRTLKPTHGLLFLVLADLTRHARTTAGGSKFDPQPTLKHATARCQPDIGRRRSHGTRPRMRPQHRCNLGRRPPPIQAHRAPRV